MKLRTSIFFLALFLIACHSTGQSPVLKIAVLDTPPGHGHSQKIIEVIRTNYSSSCPLDIELFPIYENANLTIQTFQSALEQTHGFSPQITNLSWNTLYREAYNPIIGELKKLSHRSFLVTAAGETNDSSDVHEVSDSVLGKVPKALIIGALSKEGRLASRSFYGKLLTALPPPEGTLGSSFSAALFTAKLAETLCRQKGFSVRKLLRKKNTLQQDFPSLQRLLES